MEKENKQFLNPIIITTVIIILIIGAFYFGKKSNNIIYSNDSQVNSEITIKQQNCSQLMTSFKSKVNDNLSKWDIGLLIQSANNFIIGYSPELDNCIGGYTLTSIDKISGMYMASYEIVNPETDQWINKNPSVYGTSMLKTYENYRKMLSDLTAGEISINNNSIKEDQTLGLIFCNTGYFKCPLGENLICDTGATYCK